VKTCNRRAEHVHGAVFVLRRITLSQHDDNVPVGTGDICTDRARAFEEHANHVCVGIRLGEDRGEHVHWTVL
jgi:hypothetical protein